MIVVVAAAVFTAGVAAVAIYAALSTTTFATIATTSFAAGIAGAGTVVATGTTISALGALAVAAGAGAVAGAVMGAGMTALNGGSLGEILTNGLKGAAIGAFAGAATFGAGYVSAGWGAVGQAVAHGVAGGLTGLASGGSFEKGFALAVLAYGAVSIYKYYVHEAPRLRGGKDAVYESKGSLPTQKINQFGLSNQVPVGSPLVGERVLSTSAWSEGGFMSRFFNAVGLNGTATLHDVWMNFLPGWANYPAMLPAAGIALFGSVNSPIGSALIGSDIVNSYGGG